MSGEETHAVDAVRGASLAARTRLAKWLFAAGIQKKLIILLLAFGLTPAVLEFVVLKSQEHVFRDAMNTRVAATARQISDVIDHNLAASYRDVQAFGLNSAVQNKWNWSDASSDSDLTRAMNGYVVHYKIYRLMLLLDTNGTVVGVNTKDNNGQALATKDLIGRSFANESWFADAHAGRFIEGRNGLTGTVVGQPVRNSIVARLYGDDSFVIPFSAPLRDQHGDTIGIWVNFADFRVAETVVDRFYRNLAENGMADAELAVVDRDGVLLVEYDPTAKGFSDLAGYKRDFSLIGNLNLAKEGEIGRAHV